MTDVSGMTLEGFFLADYERLRERVKELEEEVDKLTPDGYGCVDQHKTCDAVMVSVAGTYDIKAIVKHGMDAEQLRKASEMDNDGLLSWAKKSYRSSSYGSRTTPIRIDHHRYQYTLTFNETRGCGTYVTDGDALSELVDIDRMEEDMVDNLMRWCRAEHFDALKLAAIGELRERIKSVLASLDES